MQSIDENTRKLNRLTKAVRGSLADFQRFEEEANKRLEQIHKELTLLNESAAASLREGLEETLTLHRLKVFPVLGQSFKTTNCLESLNAVIEQHCAKVDHWKTSNQKHRWMAAALLDIEPRLRRIRGYQHLTKLRQALKRELRRGAPALKHEAA